jgi:hypothetical protein
MLHGFIAFQTLKGYYYYDSYYQGTSYCQTVNPETSFYSTSNGGETWQYLSTVYVEVPGLVFEQYPTNICAFDSNTVFYTDGGATFQWMTPPYQIDSLEPASIVVSYDGGRSWTENELDIYSNGLEQTSTSVLGDSIAVAGFERELVITKDRWKTWKIIRMDSIAKLSNSRLIHFEFLEDSTLMMASYEYGELNGENSAITNVSRSRDFGETWEEVFRFKEFHQWANSSFDFIDSKTWLSYIDIWVAGHREATHLLYFSEGGEKVDTLRSFPAYNLWNPFVCAYDKDLIISQYLMGTENGLMIHYNNGQTGVVQYDTIRAAQKMDRFHEYCDLQPNMSKNLQLETGVFLGPNKFIGVDRVYNAIIMWERPTSGVEDNIDVRYDGDIDIRPNPATDFINLTVSGFEIGEMLQYSICTIDGRVIESNKTPYRELKIDVSDYARGVYVCKIMGKEKSSTCIFIVK